MDIDTPVVPPAAPASEPAPAVVETPAMPEAPMQTPATPPQA